MGNSERSTAAEHQVDWRQAGSPLAARIGFATALSVLATAALLAGISIPSALEIAVGVVGALGLLVAAVATFAIGLRARSNGVVAKLGQSEWSQLTNWALIWGTESWTEAPSPEKAVRAVLVIAIVVLAAGLVLFAFRV